jgi:3-oxoacyl-[acyl-carrier-protein] synthase-3
LSAVRSIIVATGSYIPPRDVPNARFHERDFRGPDGRRIDKPTPQVVAQFEAITGIRERRYASEEMVTSDIAAEAAARALGSSDVDGEDLDYIIVAHNFGDVRAGSRAVDVVPSLAARVKARLKIKNPRTVAMDLVFGCPGWLQGMIQADYMIRSGEVRRVMVIGAEILSRVADPHDRDSMLYADGAGATILEGRESQTPVGILAHAVRSDTLDHSTLLAMGPSYEPAAYNGDLFLKMHGGKVYRYALQTVPGAIRECLDRADVSLPSVAKLLLHQANGKLDQAVLSALYESGGMGAPPRDVMPMTISWLGNSSVATLPTLLDLLRKQKLDGHRLHAGDVIVLASVGAGMHANAIAYRIPE